MKNKEKVIRIQPKSRPDMTRPYPYFIDEQGFVGRQDFWKGEPFQLIGFSPTPEQEFDEKQIDLSTFLQNPKIAIGMYPIFVYKNKEWHTYQDRIESVNSIIKKN